MHGHRPIPDWALPYLAAALALAALALLILSVVSARKTNASPRKRWGNTVGYLGGSISLATMSYGAALQPDLLPWPLASFAAGFIMAGIGGSLAGWQRGPRF
jgi:hypothetical protein